jgi:hypothetical protein
MKCEDVPETEIQDAGRGRGESMAIGNWALAGSGAGRKEKQRKLTNASYSLLVSPRVSFFTRCRFSVSVQPGMRVNSPWTVIFFVFVCNNGRGYTAAVRSILKTGMWGQKLLESVMQQDRRVGPVAILENFDQDDSTAEKIMN